jgi:hypothetical protein
VDGEGLFCRLTRAPYFPARGVTSCTTLLLVHAPNLCVFTQPRPGPDSYWNVGPGSLRLDARELDQLGPLLGFFGDELSELGGRTREHVTSKVGEAPLYRGIGESGIDLFVKLL